MDCTAKILAWIDEEIAMERTESPEASEARFLEPQGLYCILANVLGAHIEDFLKDKSLVMTLKGIMQQRGLIGQDWFITLTALGMEMNKEQLKILGWLMEGDARKTEDVSRLWKSGLLGPEAN